MGSQPISAYHPKTLNRIAKKVWFHHPVRKHWSICKKSSSSHVICRHRLLTAFMRTAWSWTTFGACHSCFKLGKQVSKPPVSGVNLNKIPNTLTTASAKILHLCVLFLSIWVQLESNWQMWIHQLKCVNMQVRKYANANILRCFPNIWVQLGWNWQMQMQSLLRTLPPLCGPQDTIHVQSSRAPEII